MTIYWQFFALFSGFAITAMRTSLWKNVLGKEAQKSIFTKRAFYSAILRNAIFLAFWLRLTHAGILYLQMILAYLLVGNNAYAFLAASFPFVFFPGIVITVPLYLFSMPMALCIISLEIIIITMFFIFCFWSGLPKKLFALIRPDFTVFWLMLLGFLTYFGNMGIMQPIYSKALINLLSLPFPPFSLFMLGGSLIWWAYIALSTRNGCHHIDRTKKVVFILFLLTVLAEVIYALPTLSTEIHAFLH